MLTPQFIDSLIELKHSDGHEVLKRTIRLADSFIIEFTTNHAGSIAI